MSLFGMRGAWQGQERLTAEAHRAVHRAEEMGAVWGLRQTPPDLLLLALIDAADSAAAHALAAIGIDLPALRQALEVEVKRGGEALEDRSPLDPAAREVVILGVNEARRAGFEQAGAGHLLLGILEARVGAGARLLARQGADLKTLRWVIHNLEQVTGDGGAALFAATFNTLLERIGGGGACPRCGAAAHASFHFCYNCGAALRNATSRAPL